MCGNMYDVRKFEYFLSHFREMISALMELEPRFVINPYQECATTKTRRPFLNNCSMLSNTTWYRFYVNELYVGEKKTTIVKLLLGHNTLAASVNLLEFSQKADALDGEVCIFIIQACKVVEVGCLLGSSKTMDNIHWSNHGVPVKSSLLH